MAFAFRLPARSCGRPFLSVRTSAASASALAGALFLTLSTGPASAAAAPAPSASLAMSTARPAAAAAAARGSARGTAIGFGLAQLGKPYRRGATGPGAYDCSGLVSAGYRAAGVRLPRRAVDQYRRLPHVARSQARPGDLLFWGRDPRRPATVSHVAIYLGGGMILTAPRTGSTVQIKPVYTQGIMPHAVRVPSSRSADLLPVRPGTTGVPVAAVQRRLRAQGLAVPVSGRFDARTIAAVRTFQRRAHRSATGTVDDVSWALLVRNGRRDRVS